MRDRVEKFEAYKNEIDRYKALPVDSILVRLQYIGDIDAVNSTTRDVWYEYGRAKAYIHNNKGAEALEIINQVLPETEGYVLLFERAELLQLRSLLYANSYKMLLAAEDSYKAADIYLQLELKRHAASCYLTIANLQYNIGNYSLAIENGEHMIQLFRDLDAKNSEDSINLMHVYNTIGLGYFMLNSLDSAKEYYDQSYRLASMLNQEFWQGLVSGNLAIIYSEKGLVKEALENFQYDVNTSLKHEEYTSAALSLLEMGRIYDGDGKANLAKSYYDSAYTFLLTSKRPRSLSKYYHFMSLWFEQKNYHDSALVYFKKYISYEDSVHNIYINTQLQKFESEKEFNIQVADIHLLKAENELKEKELLISRISIIAFVLVSILLLSLLYTIRKNYKNLDTLNFELENKVRARTARLRQINKELDTYLYRASHDVRRPILTILGLINVADMASETEQFSIRKVIKKTALEMDQMLKKLQMAYELEQESRKNKVTTNVNDFISRKIVEINKEFPYVKFELIAKERIDFKLNLNLFNILLQNVLENACIFADDDNSRVKVILTRITGAIRVSILDTGIGIDPDHIEEVFEPYLRFSNKSKGSGLGLYLARKAVKKMDGTILVKSELDRGSEFRIIIPENRGEKYLDLADIDFEN